MKGQKPFTQKMEIEEIQEVSKHKHLGVNLQDGVLWAFHVRDIIEKVNAKLMVLNRYSHSKNNPINNRIERVNKQAAG